jgi:flagellar FliL protein
MEKYFSILLALITVMLSFVVYAEDGEGTPSKAIYYAIPEPFTINFLNQSRQKVRYLQIKVSLKSTDADAIKGAKHNLPMIQDALLDLFSDQSYDQANSNEGRILLQQDTLKTIQAILKEETDNDAIDAVYFTSFILQ